MDAIFEHEVQVRYRDLDSFGHVNNVVYATYCEEARAAWGQEAFDFDSLDDFSSVVASLNLEFRRSIQSRTTLTVRTAITEMGESSFTMSYLILDGEEVVVEAESTQVYLDVETGEPAPVPEAWREQITVADGLDTGAGDTT